MSQDFVGPTATRAAYGQQRSVTRRSGALAANAFFDLTLNDDDELRFMDPADSLTIISPRVASGAHADLKVLVNGKTLVTILGGGNSTVIRGPIYNLRIQALTNAVGGDGNLDDVTLVFTGANRIG